MIDISPSVFVFCALACEARPLIHAWQLKKLPSKGQPFETYVSKDRVLVLGGIGKLTMAGAVGYSLAAFPVRDQPPILINLGIAGHRNYPLGTVFLADKIVDSETGRSFFPQFPFSVPCATSPLVTHSKPHVDYVGDFLFDMEAIGFYEMAVKFSTSELIHSVKVVSDNAETSIANINESRVEGWISEGVDVIEALLTQLYRLQQLMRTMDSSVYEQVIQQFRFSVTNALKLKVLIQRWQLLRGDEVLGWRDADIRGAKEMLSWMEAQLNKTEFQL